jgi:hypothetical protein
VLLAAGDDIEANAKVNTPLNYAARYNAVDAARLLIENGADIHVRNDWRRTPLHAAVLGSAPDAAKLLVESGADINAKDKQDITPLQTVFKDSSGGQRVARYLMKLVGTQIRTSYDCEASTDVIKRMVWVDQ